MQLRANCVTFQQQSVYECIRVYMEKLWNYHLKMLTNKYRTEFYKYPKSVYSPF